MSGFRPPEGSLERRRSDLYALIYATWDTSMGQPVGTKTGQFFDRLVQALAPEGSLPRSEQVEAADSSAVAAGYRVAACERALRSWVQGNARRWGPDEVESFDRMLLEVREAANLEGAHMRVSRETLPVGYREAEALARDFHETYERLAPQFGYETRPESAKPWAQVPGQNQRLMVAVAAEILGRMRVARETSGAQAPEASHA
jgi:hypothetical protein